MTFISAVTLLIFIMDPFGNMVVFNNILENLPRKKRSLILLRESLIAYFIMLLFLFFGEKILGHLQIDTSALGIGGGIILFLVALGMVFPSRSVTANSNPEDSFEEPFIVPIAVPFMAGPSLIATLLLLVSSKPERMFEWFLAVTIAASLSMFVLMISPYLLKVLKRKGTKAIERLMGLILIIISVQMLLNGIEDYLNAI